MRNMGEEGHNNFSTVQTCWGGAPTNINSSKGDDAQPLSKSIGLKKQKHVPHVILSHMKSSDI